LTRDTYALPINSVYIRKWQREFTWND